MVKKLKTSASEQIMQIVEAVVYILAIIIVSVVNVYGNIYFRFIPLLFLLGIIGNVFFKRPITTTVFGMIVCICTNYLKGMRNVAEIVFDSSIFALDIALGEVFASSLFKYLNYVKESKKNKFSSSENKINYLKYAILPISIFIFFIFSYNYINSNIFELNASNKKLNNYLNQNNIKDYKIVNVTFNVKPKRNFEYKVYSNDTKRVYEYDVYTSSKEDVLDIQNINIQNKVGEYNEKISQMLLNLEIKDIDVKMVYENSEYVIEFSKTVNNIEESTLKEYSMKIATILEDSTFNDEVLQKASRALILLKNSEDTSKNVTGYFYIENYNKNKAQNLTKIYNYVNACMSVEYID